MTDLPLFEGPLQLQAERSRGPIVTVYQAVSAEYGSVLLHLLNPRLAVQPTLSEQFQKNAELLKGLDHPNLGRILDSGVSRQTPYYVTPDYPENLRAKIDRGPLQQTEAIRIACEIAEGLSHAHRSGFIHRDLRPETILFDRNGRTIVCQYGLDADPNRSARTMLGAILGSPAYMAPEQIAGLSKLATDAYSFGIVLFEMLTGRPPFQDSNPAKLCTLQTYQPAPRLDTVLPGCPEGLVRLVACLLEKEPENRVGGMGEVIETLRQIPGMEAQPPAIRPNVSGDATISTPPRPPIQPAVPPPPPPPPPPQPPRPPIPTRDPTWLDLKSGNETSFRPGTPIQRIPWWKRIRIPFWVWVVLAVLVTIIAILAVMRPWERPATDRQQAAYEQPVDEQAEPPPSSPEETALPVEHPTEAAQEAEDESVPIRTEPESSNRQDSQPPRSSASRPKQAPPPAEYDWSAKPAILLVTATTEQDRQVPASIHIDGRPLGEQTTKEVTVGPGNRRIRVVRTGMQSVRALLDGEEIPLQDGEVAIHLEPGKIARLKFVLRRS